MACLPYFKFYVADWTMGTQGLTLEEEGAYIRLLAWSWKHGPIPPDRRKVILAVTPQKLASLWRILGDFWDLTEVGYVNDRLESERASLAEKNEALSKAGKEGAEKRWAAYRLANAQANGVAIDPATGEVKG